MVPNKFTTVLCWHNRANKAVDPI